VESLSGAGTVTNGSGNAAVFTVGGNGPSAFSGVLQNGASLLGLNKVGPGTLVLTGSNTYTGGTTITGGNLQVGNGGITGSITGNVTDNSEITFFRNDVVTFSGNISGSGSLVQAGAGTLILTGTNVYGGVTTIIGGGTLQLGNDGATGSITGNVLDSGSLLFDHSTPLIFGGAIQGPGSVTVMDGPLTLTAGNTYAGGTTINAGTQLQLGNNTPTGSIIGNVVDNGTLSVFRSNDLTLGGNISGSGLLLQSGVGTLTLTGTNTYAGGTRIDGGIVSVDSNAELGVIQPGIGGITLGGSY
jgi:fibronectin-binding autotransporter adhesin